MNPNVLLTEGEQEFLAQEKSITDAVIKVIAVAKKENALIRDEEVIDSVVKACRDAVGKTQEFKALMAGARRPYITHAVELLGILGEVNTAVTGIEDVLAAARTEYDEETAHAMQKELHQARLAATELIADFKRWLYTSDSSYMFASDRTLEMPQPASPDVAKTDMLRCPRWLITHLVQARRSELKIETAWREMSDELNDTKKKLTEATGLDEIKAKDAVIKKLNASLQLMYRDVEDKTKELEEVRTKAIQLATQMRAMKNAAPATPPPQAHQPPEGSNSDAVTIKELRAEIDRLKAQAEFAPSRPRHNTIRPGLLLQSPLPAPVPIIVPVPQPAAPVAAPQSTPAAADDDLPPPPPEDDNLPPPSDEVPFAEARYWLTADGKRVALASLLTDPQMTFVDVLGRAIAGGNDADSCASYLISLYTSQDTLMTVLEHLIVTEVSRCKSVNTLFRGEELSSRVLRSYVRAKGFDYIRHILGDLIAEVATNNYFFEVDPNRSNPTMDLKANFVKLEELTQRFLDTILDSYLWVPPEFLRLCKCIYTHSAVKFANENFEQLVVAGFMFLRFICPAIAAPESYKLTAIEGAEARRTLLLVGKILQNLANGAEFKEPYLQDMNAFLKKNTQRVQTFFVKLRTYPVEIDGSAPYMVDISRSVVNRKDKIKTMANNEGALEKRWACDVSVPLDERLFQAIQSVHDARKADAAAMPTTSATPSPIPHASSSPSLGAGSSSSSSLATKEDLQKGFSSIFFDNADFVPRMLNVFPHSQDQNAAKKTVADAMAAISYKFGQIDYVARLCLQNEAAPSAYEFLHSSFTRYLFGAFAVNYCGPWLSQVIASSVGSILAQNTFIETDPAKVTDPAQKASFNRDEMLNLVRKTANGLMSALIKALPECPRSLWLFANALVLNTSQDICQWLMLHFVVPSLENPQASGLSQARPKKEAARSLQIIADVLRNYANGSNVFIDTIPMSQANWSDAFGEHMGRWSRAMPARLSDDTPSIISGAAVADSIIALSTFFKENFSLFETVFEGINTQHTIAYGIAELIDDIPPPAEKAASAVHGAAGSSGGGSPAGSLKTPSRPSSIGPMDPKERKKEEERRKKEEKERKKEEEERRKKEEKEKEKKRKEDEKAKKGKD